VLFPSGASSAQRIGQEAHEDNANVASTRCFRRTSAFGSMKRRHPHVFATEFCNSAEGRATACASRLIVRFCIRHLQCQGLCLQASRWRCKNLPFVEHGGASPEWAKGVPFGSIAARLVRRQRGAGWLYPARLIVLYCFQVSGSKQEEELSLVQFRSAGRSC
jgi:hypothetical protein